MAGSFEDAGKLQRELAEAGAQSFASLSRGLQLIASEAGAYVKKNVETGSATLEKLIAARTLEDAVEIQTGFARQAYEGFVAEATRFAGLYADLARDTYKPFEAASARAA